MNIFLEGNIGSGKSTLLEAIRNKFPQWVFHPEPVEEWRNVNGQNILDNLYRDPLKYTYPFQQAVMKHFARAPITDGLTHVWERSALSSVAVFSELSLSRGHLTREQYEHLVGLGNFDRFGCATKYVYLRTEPSRCFSNVRARGREEEKNLTLEYLVDLHNRHENVFREDKLPGVVCVNYEFDVTQVVNLLPLSQQTPDPNIV